MVTGSKLREYRQYELALLRLLVKIPGGGGEAKEILHQFEEEYQDLIPGEDYQETSIGEPKWRNKVRWGRQHLKERGFLQCPRNGVWYVTDEGRRWLSEHPDADRMPPEVPHKRTDAVLGHADRRRRRITSHSSQSITLDMLEQTKQSMPSDLFQQIWGSVYERLLAAERSRTITQISQTEIGRRAKLKLDEVHAFLRGEASTPGSEILCDWIQFCFTLELYREVASLWQYVVANEVDAALVRRVKKSAEVSRAKLGW